MRVFQVRRRVDAYVDYVAQVRANTPRRAAQIAADDESAFDWQEDGVCEFDARHFITLDAEGAEIEATEVRDV